MRKTSILIISALIILASGCQKEEVAKQEPQAVVTKKIETEESGGLELKRDYRPQKYTVKPFIINEKPASNANSGMPLIGGNDYGALPGKKSDESPLQQQQTQPVKVYKTLSEAAADNINPLAESASVVASSVSASADQSSAVTTSSKIFSLVISLLLGFCLAGAGWMLAKRFIK